IQPQQLTLGNGSNDILVLLAETFLTPGHAAVYDQYSFVVYRLAVQACGAEARIAASRPVDDEQPLGHDLDAMQALVDEQVRLVFIANPNNPTGTWLEQPALKKFIAGLPSDVIVVLDEAYLEYARQPDDHDTLDWLNEFDNLVIVRTFSKAYALAGLRIGYSISSPAVAGLLNRVRQPFNVNSLAQTAAIAALGDQSWIADGVAQNIVERARLESELGALGLTIVPSRGNFILVDFSSAERAATVNEFLLRRGVIVRPVANYGLPQYLRMTVGTPAENVRLLTELQSFADGS
ncbi:MAG: histidinol-phosphate transaminase, partial [Gammaproteobacteria bacterium]|nr:histidinol-phosphate transaminase [Gammaproteobacteria bacterium]